MITPSKINMPAIVTCPNNRCENHWNVGSDDFVVPALIAIVVGLFNFSLICAVLIALYYIPSTSSLDTLDSFLPCSNLTLPPLLYGPFFSLGMMQVCFVLNEGLILALSAKGSILLETKASIQRQKIMPYLIYCRGSVAILELVAIMACLVGVFHPSVTSLVEGCDPLSPRIKLAQSVVILQVVFYLFFLIKICVYTDPLGLSTPGLMERLTLLDSADARGSLMIDPFDPPDTERSYSIQRNLSVDASSAAIEVNIWRKKSRIVSHNDINQATKIHNDKISRKKYERRLRAIFCCLGVKGQRSRGAALEDVARGLYTIFSDSNIVLSDLIAGFSLLKKDQATKKKIGGAQSLTRKFRMVTFNMMPKPQRIGLAPKVLREDQYFDFNDVHNQIVFEDLVHYMKYAMGTYGWPMHIFDNLGCGICQLCAVTCCKFRCLSGRVRKKEFNNDNCCMCGLGAFRLQAGIGEDDIIYFNFENKIYLAPFIVCLDHHMKSVVICIRGTLSLKDTLTDMSFSPIHKDIKGIKETYVHGGMYRAALGILKIIQDEEILSNIFAKKEYRGYLVVVTGHSLGAGVASILALLIKLELQYSDEMIRCFAFSPPGALFSFPLAEYSKSFITSVILGNDMVSRLTLRSLLYLKCHVKSLLSECEIPKYQILFKTNTCSALCDCFDRSKRVARTVQKESFLSRNADGRAKRESSLSRNSDDRVQKRRMEHDGSSRAADDDIESNGIARGESPFSRNPGDVTVSVDTVPTVIVSENSVEAGDLDAEVPKDSIEWKVLNEKITTSSLKFELFKRSVSIQPADTSLPSNKLQRYVSVDPHRKASFVSESFAFKIQRAISLDVTDQSSFEKMIKGTDSSPFLAPPDRQRRISLPKSSLSIDKAPPIEMMIVGTETDVPSETRDPLSKSTSVDETPYEMLIKGADSNTSPTTTTATRVSTAEDGESICSLGMTRDRINSDPTPGGIFDNTIHNLNQHNRVDETKTFTPFFLPGRILHIEVEKSDRFCGSNNYSVKETNRENLCVILMDEGVVDDHLPNHVLNALKTCKTRLVDSLETYDREAIKKIREQQVELLCRIPRGNKSRDPRDGFIFVNTASPMTEPIGGPSLGQVRPGNRSHRLGRQRSFDMTEEATYASKLHPPVASSRKLEVRSSLGLHRISESVNEADHEDDYPDGMQTSGHAEVNVDINEGVSVDLMNQGKDEPEKKLGDSNKLEISAKEPASEDNTDEESEDNTDEESDRTRRLLSQTSSKISFESVNSVTGSLGNKLLARRNMPSESLKLSFLSSAEDI